MIDQLIDIDRKLIDLASQYSKVVKFTCNAHLSLPMEACQ